jgi:hypothetical protein
MPVAALPPLGLQSSQRRHPWASAPLAWAKNPGPKLGNPNASEERRAAGRFVFH